MEIECWVVWWNECTITEGARIISYHKTKAGAYRMARQFRLDHWARFDNMFRNSDATVGHWAKRDRGRQCPHDYFQDTLLKILPHTIKIKD